MVDQPSTWPAQPAAAPVSFFQSAIDWLKTEEGKAAQVVSNIATTVVSDVETAVEAAVPELLQRLDALVSTNMTAALGFVKAAATNPDLFNSGQKRSEVIANLTQHLEAQGIAASAQGFNSVTGVLTELAVNLAKGLWPTVLGAAFGAL